MSGLAQIYFPFAARWPARYLTRQRPAMTLGTLLVPLPAEAVMYRSIGAGAWAKLYRW